MARKFNSNSITDGTLPASKVSSSLALTVSVTSIRITSIAICDSSYVTVADTAISLTGGYIKIIGTGFVTGCTVAVDTTVATSVTFVSSTQINVQLPAKAAGTYILYLSNPNGAVAIRVNAVTFSATPTWSSTSPLTSGIVNTAISLQLAVTSDSTVVYTLQSGSTLPSGLTLSTSGLLSGTVTGITLETIYNFTIVATDVESQTSPKAFSITIQVSDPYFNSTVLLLNADATTFIKDASTNNFELTATGTPSGNVFNPMQDGYYSNYFNGSTDYVTVPTAGISNFDFSNGSYTIEFWMNPSTLPTTETAILCAGPSTSGGLNRGWAVELHNGVSAAIWFYQAGVITTWTNLGSYTIGAWQHIAIVRNGATVTVYVNGTSTGSTSVSTNTQTAFSAGDIFFGAALHSTGNVGRFFYNGYLSNCRVVKGTAVYTGNFTPPTLALTATQSAGQLVGLAAPIVEYLVVAGGGSGGGSTYYAGAGGAGGLLAGTLTVSAATSYTVTVGTGGTKVTGGSNGNNGTVSVFGPITAAGGGGGGNGGNTNVSGLSGGSGGGGSGTGDTTGVGGAGGAGTAGQGYAGGAGWGQGTGNGAGGGAGGGAGAVGGNTVNAQAGNGGIGKSNSITGTATYYAGGGGGATNSNNQINQGSGGLGGGGAGGYSGGTDGTVNTGGGGGGTAPAGINGAGIYGGAGGSGIVIVRYSSAFEAASTTGSPTVVVSGGYRVYTWTTSGTITFAASGPVTFVDSNIAAITTGTSLLTCQSNRFKDNSTNAFAITATGSPTVAVQQPFTLPAQYTGYGSGYFNGSTDWVTTPNNAAFNLSSANWTIEEWYYPTSYYAGNNNLCCLGVSNTDKIVIATIGTPGTVYYILNGTVVIVGSAAGTLNNWNHIALCKNGATTTLYLNGTSIGTTASVPTSTSKYVSIGYDQLASGSIYVGYISNVRVVNGTALYTTNFTLPTTPLTAVSGTSLLTLQTPQAQNNNQFRDSSQNNFAITRNGTPTQGTFTPFSQTGWSGYFNGSTDYLTKSNINFSTNPFTIEGWFYTTISSIPANFNMWGMDNGSGSAPKMCLTVSSTQFVLYCGNYSADLTVSHGGFNTNTWYHVALVRTGISANQVKIYLNGIALNSTSTVLGDISGITGGLTIGYMGESFGSTWLGYISNFRIVNGLAAYTAAFTPSTTPLIAGVPVSSAIEILVVGGGGGARGVSGATGGTRDSGGGGAGGVIYNPAVTVASGVTYQIVVGGGGPDATNGTSSSWNATFIAAGGGTSGIAFTSASAGGSGGGAGNYTSTAGASNQASYSGWTVYGNAGGGGADAAAAYGAGGGGGAGAVGTAGSSTTGGTGGIGIVNSISGAATYYAGGGGGGAATGASAAGGWGGGGASTNSAIGTAGTVNTGGGGGGVGNTTGVTYAGGAGGSGVVILRFRATSPAPTSTTGSPTVTTVGLYQIYTWTVSGSITFGSVLPTSLFPPSLLTLQDNRFKDNSINAFAITTAGTPSIQAFSPFAPAAAYSTSVVGGSVYTPSSSYLGVAYNAALNLSTGDFTIECWINATSGLSFFNYATGASIAFLNNLYYLSSNGSSFDIAAGVAFGITVPANQWSHFAFVRYGNVFTPYINGVAGTTTTSASAIFNPSSQIYIGNSSGLVGTSTGYMSSFRIVKGTAVYTANFTPPTAPLTAVTNTSLLLNATNAGIYDATAKNDVTTVGSVKVSSGAIKNGTGSMYFNGSTDYLQSPTSQNFNFGTGSLTVECWLYLTSYSANVYGASIIDFGSGDTATRLLLYFPASSGTLYIRTSAATLMTSSSTVSLNTWTHVAFVRNGAACTLYLNGVSVGTATSSNNWSDSNCRIGVLQTPLDGYLPGYIDDLRITKYARYTTAFTPPASAMLGR